MAVRSLSSPAVRRFSATILGHPKLVLLVWIVAFVALVPIATLYLQSINYSTSSAGIPGSQSAQAQQLLASVHPELSTLIVAAPPGSNASALCQRELAFASGVAQSDFSYYNSTQSVCGEFATLLDSVYEPLRPTIAANYTAFRETSFAVYGFPAAFLANWTPADRATINGTFTNSSGQMFGYDLAFRDWLLANFSSTVPPAELVNRAVASTAPAYFGQTPLEAFRLTITLRASNVVTYRTNVTRATAAGLNATFAAFRIPFSSQLVTAFLAAGDGGTNYVQAYGWSSAPTALRSQFVAPDGSLTLLFVTFNVTDGFRGPDNFYPAQAATPKVRLLATTFFGPAAGVTGNGAISYDTQAATSAEGFLFALTFVFLAGMVALTLRSWIAPLLTLLFVVLGTLVGYFAIWLTALFLGPVSYLVTYVQEAVVLGIATDFLVFIVYRYREELLAGRDHASAVRTATETAGPAVLTSAVTVAAGLGALYFLPGTQTWGPVLFLNVLLVGIAVATLLPVLLLVLGPRLFLRSRRASSPRPIERSPFYRAADWAVRRKGVVLAVVLIVGVPTIVGALSAPTTYDLTQGLPASYPSVATLNAAVQAFGSNLLYPTYVLVHNGSGYLSPNGSLSSGAIASLHAVAQAIYGTATVTRVAGPFALGTNLTNATAEGAIVSGATSFVFANGTWAYWVVYSSTNPFTDAGASFVASLRSHPGWVVGGAAAATVDQRAQNSYLYPELELLIVVLIGVVLGVAFRSISDPLISLSGVFLSITATTVLLYGITTYLLHQALIYLIPVILFVILVSLGNDYTVFILSRVREERQSAPAELAIPRGIGHSGAVVTSLGLILAVSLGSLALQPLGFLTQLGIAFAISLVLDTFVVRLFYFPAMLRLAARPRRHNR